MKEEEMKEWDDALLDLVNKGLIKVVKKNGVVLGFVLSKIDLEMFEKGGS